MTTATLRDRLALEAPEYRLLAVVVAVELVVTAGYFLLSPAELIRIRYAVYPFVWINAGLWAVLRIDSRSVSSTHRWLAGTVAGAYFLLLAFVTGLIGITTSLPLLALGIPGGAVGVVDLFGGAIPPLHASAHSVGWQVRMASPGWGPRIAYVAHEFYVYFIPYRVVGYLSLAYLVYAAVLDAGRSTLGGVVGVASCVGCSFPLVTALVGVVGGGSAAALTGTVTAYSMDLSTVAFLAAVALLSYRPTRSGSRTT
jgi:hypothetical protein